MCRVYMGPAVIPWSYPGRAFSGITTHWMEKKIVNDSVTVMTGFLKARSLAFKTR